MFFWNEMSWMPFFIIRRADEVLVAAWHLAQFLVTLEILNIGLDHRRVLLQVPDELVFPPENAIDQLIHGRVGLLLRRSGVALFSRVGGAAHQCPPRR